MAKQWYVVRVQTGREMAVKGALEKNIKAKGLESQISRVLVPTEKVSEIRGGKKKVMERKLYPGYLIIEIELNDETRVAVQDIPGIGDFVGGKTPTPLAQHEIEKILMLEQVTSTAEKPTPKIGFKKGDNVRIKEGPFENFDGTVDEIIPAKGIVKVIVPIFGRVAPVELEYWQVEAI